jgi:NADPH:quinone reductase-like Zn-dependent oxidoreductase
MKAVVLTDYGGVDKLQLREVPDPRPDRRSIVVRVAGAGINPIDWKMRGGAAKAGFPVTFPAILGRDASGVVAEVGDDVSEFNIGDRVMGVVRGGYAELVTAPAGAWAHVPEGMDLIDAGALPLVLLTGAQLAEEGVAPSAGDTVLVTGALGSVGRVALYSLKARGAKVWAGVLKSQIAGAGALGADGVVSLDDAAEIAKLPTLSAIADTVDGETIQKLYAKLKPGGVIGSVLGEPRGARDRGLVVRTIVSHPDSAMLAKYASAVASRKWAIPIAERMPLARAAEAQRLAETGHLGGKVLLLA